MTARTYALGIEYCGTTFNGWQVQPDRPSVQAALDAIQKLSCVQAVRACMRRIRW